ncbi:MAG TPA: hypothetical protein VGH15_11020, partial [Caulobacteraceae bacterium]
LTPYLSGTVNLTGGLGSFTSLLTIYSGSVLTLAGASAHNYVLANNTAAATTTLILAPGAAETGVLHGYGANDTLDLAGVLFSSKDSVNFTPNATPTSGGSLTVSDGTHSETVKLAGDYTAANFMLANDGHGRVDVTVSGALPAAHLAAAMAAFAAPTSVDIGAPSTSAWRGEPVLAVRAV